MISALKTTFSPEKPESSSAGSVQTERYTASKHHLNRFMKKLRNGELKDQGSSQKVVVFGR